LTLPVVYQLGRRFLGSVSALLLMALLTFSPFHIRFSQEVRPYALGLLGITVYSYFIWRLRGTGGWRNLIPMMLSAVIFSLSHYFANVVFGAWLLFLGFDIVFRNPKKYSLRAVGGLLATGFVCFLLLLMLGWGPTLLKVSEGFGETLVDPEQLTAPAEEKPNLGTGPEISEDFIRTQILGPLGAGSTDNSILLFNSLVIVGVISLIVQKEYKLDLLLVLWVGFPVVGIVTFLVHRGTFFASRYIIFVLPAYLTLLAVGILALPRVLKRLGATRMAVAIFLLIGGLVFADFDADIYRLYYQKDKEDWRLVGNFIARNAHPGDAVIAVKAEPAMNWYYPPATAEGNTYSKLEVIQDTVSKSERSWVILSIYSSGIDSNIKAWLSDSEHGSVKLVLDPVITVYYLGQNIDKEQLLQEIQGFALPVNHALYASLARENRRNPEIARRYYELAIEYAPDDEIRVQYEAALDGF